MEKIIEKEIEVVTSDDCKGCALYNEISSGGPGGGRIPSCKFTEKGYSKTVRQVDGSYPKCPMEEYNTIIVKTVYKRKK